MVLASYVYTKFLAGKWFSLLNIFINNSLCRMQMISKWQKSISSWKYRQPWNIVGNYKFLCACNYVRLLLLDVLSTRIKTLTMVEETYHTNSAGKLSTHSNADFFVRFQQKFAIEIHRFYLCFLLLLFDFRSNSVYWWYILWIQCYFSNAHNGQRQFHSSASYRICLCFHCFWTFTLRRIYGSQRNNKTKKKNDLCGRTFP